MPLLWLASFPKSGNTWVRALLANYVATGASPVPINRLSGFAMSDAALATYERVAGRPLAGATIGDLMPFKAAAHRMLAGDAKTLVFAKTHSALRRIGGTPTITPAATAGAIYILRNPLDVTLSYSDHYGLSHAQTVEAMASDSLTTVGRADRAPEYLGSWSEHVRGWTTAPGLKRLTLRYEDLAADAAEGLRRMLNFLRHPVDEDRIARAVAHSSFETLSSQEALTGFAERSKNQKRFFRAGRSGQWRDVLAPDLVAAIVGAHGQVMADFGYLDDKGDPI